MCVFKFIYSNNFLEKVKNLKNAELSFVQADCEVMASYYMLGHSIDLIPKKPWLLYLALQVCVMEDKMINEVTPRLCCYSLIL